jgi:hypothetical protein
LTGAGRGLVTAAAVEEGELLMVAAPLGILYCPVSDAGGHSTGDTGRPRSADAPPKPQHVMG